MRGLRSLPSRPWNKNLRDTTCRVATAGCPTEALTRSVQGVFHHTAPPLLCLAERHNLKSIFVHRPLLVGEESLVKGP